AARAWWCCSTSPPTRAGQTCRFRAPSSTCSVESSASRAPCRTPRRRLPRRARARRCRPAACSTASVLSKRRPRPRGPFRPAPPDFTGPAKADNPPGFYGPPEGLLAVNPLAPADRIAPVDVAPLNARVEASRQSEPQDLRGPIFAIALAMLLIDAIVVFWLAGGVHRLIPRRRMAAALVLGVGLAAIAAIAGISPARADQASDQFAMKATLETRLAYVITGDADADSVSKAGLAGLTLYLAQRTALEAGEPIGLDLERDELAFFPLIYWPITPNARKPSAQALARIDAYMKQGGTVLFDTRDAVT